MPAAARWERKPEKEYTRRFHCEWKIEYVQVFVEPAEITCVNTSKKNTTNTRDLDNDTLSEGKIYCFVLKDDMWQDHAQYSSKEI